MNTLNSALDDQALAWLVRLNSGAVSAAYEAEFFTWLNTSASHQEAYIRAEALWQQADIVASLSHNAISINPNKTENESENKNKYAAKSPLASTQINSLQNKPRRIKPAFTLNKGSMGYWAVAACTVLVIGTTGFYTLFPSPIHYHLSSKIGEQQQVVLDDGSRVVLNTNSQLDVELNAHHRIATLIRGEVYFDVTPNPQKPFDVITDKGMVRVLGTHFSVRQQTGDTTVTVSEGRVALGARPLTTEQFTPAIELTNNQQLSLTQAQSGIRAQTLNAQSALAWRDKQLVFQKQKLAYIVAELNRYFAVHIALSEPALGDREITAVIQLSDIKTTLNALCQPLKLHADTAANGRDIILSSLP